MKSSFTIRYHHDIVTRPVKITASVTQQNEILYHTVFDLRCFLSPLRIDFSFDSLDPLQLRFGTDCKDMDLFPVYIDRIALDDLVDIPYLAHTGILTRNNQEVDVTNCLYTDGELVYNFKFPFCTYCTKK